ncbi:SDR family NAD(P)-dependent oxidoreductase [Microbacterium sp. SA39]|uniref:SDR family NAD(P)-dependent oxidoreductase n=1 Tax=Microbacterium sp. SA39 TaxID=1263625 RepID=UPI0005F9C210|nr:SDR family oxidoreductase [Microbacterium sp. SA39]KJQ53889.1 2,5-dichloro-2,5-cyclohexadiene-1,4-diol dehydrogenase [Microbacterium sp. SA39]
MIAIDLSGRTAVVTGGSAGIGAACVTALQAAGARVLSLDPSLPSSSAPDVAVVGDVTDPSARRDVLRRAEGADILVNNAAIQYEQRLGETSLEDLERLLRVNVIGAVEMTREFGADAPAGGAIINMGSVLGVTGDPALAVYSVSKGAVINLTRTAALEYAGRLRVNAVLPGAIRTPLTTRAWDATGDARGAEKRMSAIYPVGRVGEPHEVGAVVAFLASPLASFINGALLTVDGGLLAANAEWALERLG